MVGNNQAPIAPRTNEPPDSEEKAMSPAALDAAILLPPSVSIPSQPPSGSTLFHPGSAYVHGQQTRMYHVPGGLVWYPQPQPPEPNNTVVPNMFPQASKKTSNRRKKRQNNQPGEAPKKASKRKLSNDDTLTIINYWKDHYSEYGKSNKRNYSKKAAEFLNREWFAKQTDKTLVDAERLERFFHYWLSRYKLVSKKFQDSGWGLQGDDPESLKEAAEKNMKHFWLFHSFLASRENVNPPVLLQSREEETGARLDVDMEYGQFELGTGGQELSSEEEKNNGNVSENRGSHNPSNEGHTSCGPSSGKRRRNSTGTMPTDGVAKKQRTSDSGQPSRPSSARQGRENREGGTVATTAGGSQCQPNQEDEALQGTVVPKHSV